jgi:PAS domain S-box-containing protein
MGELEQGEVLLAGEKRILEMIARSHPLVPILEALCRLVEEVSSGSLATVLLLDAENNRLWHAAAPSLPPAYTEGMGGIVIGPSVGSCGTAAYRREPVMVCDIAADPLWADYRDVALSHGLRASWSTPIFSSSGNLLGTFAILAREPRSPTPQHHRLIEQITHLASIAIERNRTETALQESGERFRWMADAISEVIWFTALKPEKVLYVSPSFERIWGVPATNLYRNPRLWTEMIHPEDRDRVAGTFSRWIAGEKMSYHDVEYRIVQPSGDIRWIHERGVLRLDERGKPCLASGISTDITERKNSQNAMRAAKARFEGILEIAEDAIISVDSSQGIVLFNQGAEKVFGYAQGEVIGQPLDLLLPQRFAKAHGEHIEAFGTSLEVSRAMGQRREVFGVRKDGHEFPAEASISKLDLGGELFFTVILRDITERKQAAEALRVSEHLARGQVEALSSTLAALSRESEPEKLLEHVLATIGRQLEAHSLGVYEMNANTGRVQLVANCDDGRLLLASPAETQTSPQFGLTTRDHPIWTEFFRTGAHCVIGDIQSDTVRVRVAETPDSPWYDWSSDLMVNPTSQAIMQRLHSIGVVATLAVPTFVAGKVTGLISIRFHQPRAFRPEEIELTRALAHQATLAIQLLRLSGQSRQAAVEAERNRLARDIHDTLAQGFTGVIVQLEAAADATSKGLTKEAEEHLVRAGDLARESLKEARRSVRALRPQALEQQDLCEALDRLIRKMTAGTVLRTEFSVRGQPPPLPADWEENLLRIGQEVLTNALRHAHASEFKTQLVFDPKGIRLELRDNGRGFDSAARHDGFGLLGIRERVEAMGGQLSIESATGKGTEIAIVLPLANIPSSSLA